MPQPVVIIEIKNGILEGVSSNMDIKFFHINRDNEDGEAPFITGPHEPWVVKEDLSTMFPDEPEITQKIVSKEEPTHYV